MNKTNRRIHIMIAALLLCISAWGNPAKKKAADLRVLAAYSQQIQPGMPGGNVETEYHFVIVWQSAKMPESFFWRGENGWLTCETLKATAKGVKKTAGEMHYTTKEMTGDIKKGDTLILNPIKGGKFPVPSAISPSAKNTLYYKTSNGKWISVPIKSMTVLNQGARE